MQTSLLRHKTSRPIVNVRRLLKSLAVAEQQFDYFCALLEDLVCCMPRTVPRGLLRAQSMLLENIGEFNDLGSHDFFRFPCSFL